MADIVVGHPDLEFPDFGRNEWNFKQAFMINPVVAMIFLITATTFALFYASPIDPARFVARKHASRLFLQFGERDEVFGRETAGRLTDAASEPKQVRWYDADHLFRSEEAKRERVEWLHTQLGSGYRRMKGKTGRATVRRR